MAGKKVVILQSNYIPWKGYFDLIYNCDEFIFLDHVQYTKNDWRNRNRYKTAQGAQWLTLPVNYKFSERPRIVDVQVNDKNWAAQHFQILKNNLAECSYFNENIDWLGSLYEKIATEYSLSKINQYFISEILAKLGIRRNLSCDIDYFSAEEIKKMSPNDRVVKIAQKAQTETYITGPAAKDYLDTALFKSHNIQVVWANYDRYPIYTQPHGTFEHAVTAFDLIFNTGPDALNFLKKDELLRE